MGTFTNVVDNLVFFHHCFLSTSEEIRQTTRSMLNYLENVSVQGMKIRGFCSGSIFFFINFFLFFAIPPTFGTHWYDFSIKRTEEVTD